MSELLLKGHPLNSSAAIREVIADMRLTQAAANLTLDMACYATPAYDLPENTCYVCAGGSAVIFGLGGVPKSNEWSDEQWQVAEYYNSVRVGLFEDEDTAFAPIPEVARAAYSTDMYSEVNPNFFAAWERFADAVEAAENAASPVSKDQGEAQ